MTRADQIWVQMIKDILASPFSDNGVPIRPYWPSDHTPAHTRKVFGQVHSYDLNPEAPDYEFPLMTLRRTYWKSALQEVLWIYRMKSNRIADLDLHIWDSWDVGDGTIGKAYGYQIAQKAKHHKVELKRRDLEHHIVETGGAWRQVDGQDLIEYPSAEIRTDADGTEWFYLDQMDAVLWDLKHSTYSRSIMTSTYNHHDLAEMGLRPCAYGMYYNVTRDEETGQNYLNAVLQQRSQDMLTANNWNTVQYAFLLMLIANEVGMTPGKFIHMIYDCHLYDRHEAIARAMVEKAENDPNDFAAPKVYIKPGTTFYTATKDSIVVEDYQYEPFNENIEVAV